MDAFGRGPGLPRLRSPALRQPCDVAGEAVGHGVLRIEGAAVPDEQVLVLLVVGVGEGLEELGVAPVAAHVFRRAAPLGHQETGVGRAGLRLREALDPDVVLPIVAEVVDVTDGLGACRVEEVLEPGLGLGEGAFLKAIRIGAAPGCVCGAELVQVRVSPAQGGL